MALSEYIPKKERIYFMNIIKKYLNNVYLYVLLLIPILCMSAGATYTFGKIMGWHPTSPWRFVLLFDFSQIVYLLISIYFIYKKRRISSYTEKDIFWIKFYITIALFIQYNFIMHVFPTHNAWSCSFIFMGVVAFLFDTKLMLTHILGYVFFLIVAHILHWEELVPNNLGEKLGIMMYQIVVFLITSVVFFFITFLVERFLIQEQEEETENVYLMEKQLEYYQNCDMLDKELRKFRHDIKGHFIGMEYLLEHKNYEELSTYFKELNDSFTFQEKMYFSGNLIIDSILNYDMPNRCNPHVNKVVYGRLVDIVTISSIDLCTLFSNMLSNAINAVNECSLEEHPKLSVRFDYGSKFFSITIINSIPAKNITLKKEEIMVPLDRNHGHGMRKIRDICEKYNGEFNQTGEGNTITTTAYLPL